jgi:hypothetical protein
MQIDSDDYLQDIVFDYYGTRMAICGSDRKIKIYEKTENEEDEGFLKIAEWEVNINIFNNRLMMLRFGRFNGHILNLG